MNRRAKIIATLGPASRDEATIRALIQAGMNIARINFSHGTHADHAASIERIRKIAAELRQPITIMQDLQGPKIRVGDIQGGLVELLPGQQLVLTSEPVLGNAQRVSIDYDDLPASVQPGGRILLDDGNLELRVLKTNEKEVITQVIFGGLLKPNKGVNLPKANLKVPSVTEKDLEDLAFGLEIGIDAIALSFVRQAQDVAQLQAEIHKLAPNHPHIPIIAKLEKPEALDNLHEIIHIADGVMVARGDLGVEMSPEEVPIAQKRIIRMANRHLKSVITATQMLESMIENPRPTRAEASDVANAILDGSDAVMLSGETAVGAYPVKAVEMMNAIIRQAEANTEEWGRTFNSAIDDDLKHEDALFITRAASELAHDRDVAAIAVFTTSGRTARLMAKARPEVPILAFTPDERTYQQFGLLWGVQGYQVSEVKTVEAMLLEVEKVLEQATPLEQGQEVVLIAGFPVGARRPANFALLHRIGEF